MYMFIRLIPWLFIFPSLTSHNALSTDIRRVLLQQQSAGGGGMNRLEGDAWPEIPSSLGRNFVPLTFRHPDARECVHQQHPYMV